jgi:phosphatidylserine synthase
LAFALSLIAAILLSYHTYGYDLSILFVAALVVLEVLLSSQNFRAWSKQALYVCVGVLFCSPLYMVLTIRYKHSESIGAVLLVFFVVLFVEFVRIQPRPSARPAPDL